MKVTCDFCGEATANYSTYRVAGAAAPHIFCRACFDPELPIDEQQRRGGELVFILVERALGEGGNTSTIGHA
jgi:hypothetical protein